MRAYIIPYHTMGNTPNNKESIQKAIRFLSDKYLIDNPYMEEYDKIALLECIVDLTHIYFNMSLEE